jgi:hypothetical protein
MVCESLAPATIFAPWGEVPYRLFSWWDMERFSAGSLVALGTLLERVGTFHSSSPGVTDAWREKDATDNSGLGIFLQAVKDECAKVNLQFSSDLADRTIEQIKSGGLKNSEVAVRLAEIASRVRDEMRLRVFLNVSPEYVKYYEKQDAFGAEVEAKFQSALYDVREAGNCLCMDRSTACVFHLMRVSEHGLRALAKKLKVALTHKGNPQPLQYADWDKVITAINGRITAARSLTPGKRKVEQLNRYSDLADHCLYMKDIWRNEVSHARRSYNQAEALGAWNRVEAFMKMLAKETK